MISFIICLIALILGYLIYGKVVEGVFGPDDRPTPAMEKADGVDFIALPTWKIFMIQFLNIAGTGPIFGAIMGAKFGPSAFLWIVFGCIFAGAVHDYLSGMVSMRNGGIGLPEVIGKYLGNKMRKAMLVLTVFLLMIVGAVGVIAVAYYLIAPEEERDALLLVTHMAALDRQTDNINRREREVTTTDRSLRAKTILKHTCTTTHGSHLVLIPFRIIRTPLLALIVGRVQIQEVREETPSRHLTSQLIQIIVWIGWEIRDSSLFLPDLDRENSRFPIANPLIGRVQ